jgi:hypothetical protein
LDPQADSKTSLIVKYIQAGDLGAKYGGDIIDYELRPGYDMMDHLDISGLIYIYIIIYIYIHIVFLVFFQISNRWLPHGYPMVTPLFSHALEFTPRTVRKTRYARKEKYLEDPDAGVLNLEESGGSPDQVGNIKGKQPGKQPPNRSHPKKRIFRSDCCDGLHPNMEIRLQSDAEVNCRNLGVWSTNISIQSLYISNII